MRNYLKYLSDTMYSFQRKYDLTDNQMRFLLFINDEKGSFTKRFIRESMYVSKNFNDRMFPELVKRVSGLNNKDSFLTVDYAKLVPVLVESIKELKQEIKDLKNVNN